MHPQVRVVQKNLFSTLNLACKLIPFYDIMNSTKKNPSSLGYFLRVPQEPQNIQRKFWRIQRKYQKTGYFSFWPLTHFCRISNMVGYIPEVLMLLLTPILTYIHMVYVKAPHISYMLSWHIWHLAFDIHIYVNIGVKRSVRTSGMQPTILNI